MKHFLAATTLLLIVPLAGCATSSKSTAVTPFSVAKPAYGEDVVFGSVRSLDGTPRADAEFRIAPATEANIVLSDQLFLTKPVVGKTDDNGDFAISGVKPGSYLLFVSRPGLSGRAVNYTTTIKVPQRGKNGLGVIF